MIRRSTLPPARKGDILSVVLLIASMLMLLGIVYVVLVHKTAKVPLVEVDLLTFAPPRAGLVLDISFDEIRQNDEWMEALRRNQRNDTERYKKVGLDPDLTPDDVSRMVFMVSAGGDTVAAVRLRPGHSVDHARLMSLEGASEARIGNKVYVKCRQNHHHLYDANTLLVTKKDSTMRDLLGRGFVSTGLNEEMKRLHLEAEPGAIRVVAEAKLANTVFQENWLGLVLRGNLTDLVGGKLKGASLSIGLKEDKLAASVTIHYANPDSAKRSEKDFDRVLASWKTDLKKLLKTMKVDSEDYDDLGAQMLNTLESASKGSKLIIRGEAGIRSAEALWKNRMGDLW